MKMIKKQPLKKQRFDEKAYNARLIDFEDIRSQLNNIVVNYNEMQLPALSSPAEFFRLFEDTENKIKEFDNLELRQAGEELILITADYFDTFCNNLRSIQASGIKSKIVHSKNILLSAFRKGKSNLGECWLAAAALKEIFDFESGQVVFKKDFHEALKMFFVS